VVGEDGVLRFPWLEAAMRSARAMSGAHALLLHGPDRIGLFDLATTLAQSHLCEATRTDFGGGVPCGGCVSCRLFSARTHPDAYVTVPEAWREPLEWPLGDSAPEPAAEAMTSRSKPSQDIRIDDVREIIAFAQTTSARGRGKVVIVHPAERMNPIAANALLKTLEEPADQTRFILGSAAPDGLLPTIRSRCQTLPVPLPAVDLAVTWLERHGVEHASVLLAAGGGSPNEALDLSRLGIAADVWVDLPRGLVYDAVDRWADWPLPRFVQTLQKMCHDCLCAAVGATPRYFPAASLPGPHDLAALSRWARQLRIDAEQSDHPWNAGLKVDALLQQARRAVNAARVH
jgi:DNA polymerase-3 subunit delta'